MPDTLESELLATLDETLSIMAFVCITPIEGPTAAECTNPEDETLRVSVAFSGLEAGVLELLCPVAFGRALATSVIPDGLEGEALEAVSRDVLREVVNVMCGSLLRKRHGPRAGAAHLGIPLVESASPAEWQSALASDALVADADGHIVVVRVIADPA